VPEWEVIYRAVADFSDLNRKAAESVANLEAMKKAAEAQSSAEMQNNQRIVASRQADLKAMRDQASAMDMLQQKGQQYQRWVNWEGNQSADMYLAYLQRQEQYQRLLNIQKQRGFYSPLQDYAFRNQEITQMTQYNRAAQGGYATPDQYLQYLAAHRTAMQLENATWLQRVAVLKQATDAAVAQANAVGGTHQSAAQLMGGADKLQQSLRALDAQSANPQVNLDDTQFGADVTADTQALQALDAFTAQPGVALDDVQFRADVAKDMDLLGTLGKMVARPRIAIDNASALTALDQVIAAMQRAAAAHSVINLGVAATAPLTPQAPMTGGANSGASPNNNGGWAAAAAAAAAASGAARAQQAALANANNGSGSMASSAAAAAAASGAARSASQATLANIALAAAQQRVGQSASTAVPQVAALSNAQRQSALNAIMASAAQGQAGAAMDNTGKSAQRMYGWMGLLTKEFTLFGGAFGGAAIFGSIALWHIALDTLIETLAILVPALSTAAFGITAFAVAAAATGQQIYTQFKAITTVSSALNTTIPPLTGNLQNLTNAVRPQVFSLLGAALYQLNHQGGLVQEWALRTGSAFQDFAAKVDVFLNKGGNGLNTFLNQGAADLTQLAKLFAGFGAIFARFITATATTQVAEKLLSALVFVVDGLASALNRIPIGAIIAAVAIHSIAVYGGLLTTTLQKVALGFDAMLARFGPTSQMALNLAQHLGATNDQLAAMSKGTPFLKQIASDAAAGSSNAYQLAQGLGVSHDNLVKLVSQDSKIQSVAKSLGMADEEVASIALGFAKSGTSVEDFASKAVGGTGKLAAFTSGLSQADKDAVNLAGAIGGSQGAQAAVDHIGSSASTAASKTGIFTKAFTGLGSWLSGNWVLIAAAAAAGLAYIVYQAQQASAKITNFVGSMNAELDKIGAGASLVALPALVGSIQTQLDKIHKGAEDLTGYWGQSFEKLFKAQQIPSGSIFSATFWKQTGSQIASNFSGLMHVFGIGLSTAANDTQALSDEQKHLIGYFDNLTSTVYQSGKGYESLSKQGFSLSQSMSILTLAGVKQGDSLSLMRQKVTDLLTGYQAMSQRSGEIGSDMNVITVAASNQLKSMGQLNTAWDAFTKIVSAPVDTFLTVASAFNTFATDAQLAGAGASGLATNFKALTGAVSPNALKLQTDFQTTYTSITQMFDAMRNSSAVSGSGDFTKFAKDAVAALLPLAGSNKAAAAEISTLAQEAGGPATTNLKELGKWAGNVKDPMKGMYDATQNAAVAASNLSADAARLSSTLANDLTPLMATSILQAAKAGPSMQNFASAVFGAHGNIDKMVPSGTALASVLTKVSGNSANAKALFIGMAESMGLSKKQADDLWSRVNGKPLKPVADTIAATHALNDLRAEGIKAVSPPAKAPTGWAKVWSDIFNGFANDVDHPITHFFTSTLPGAYNTSNKILATGWNKVYNGFANDVSGKIESWFVNSLPHAVSLVSGSITHAWLSAWSGFDNDVAKPIANWFDASLPHAVSLVSGSITHAWLSAWSGFDNDVAKPIGNWFANSVPHALALVGGAISHTWLTGWSDFENDVAKPIGNWLANSVPHALAVLGGVISHTWLVAWSDFENDVVKPMANWFANSVPHALAVLGGAISHAWLTAWSDFVNDVIKPMANWFANSVPHALAVLGGVISHTWLVAWSDFVVSVAKPMANWFANSVPHALSVLSGVISHTWLTAWSDFDRDVVGNLRHFFGTTMPGWLTIMGGAIKDAFKSAFEWSVDKAVAIINTPINFINNDVLKHLPGGLHIPTITKPFAAGGGAFDGSVPGPASHDHYNARLMGGEFVLRQPARMAVERDYGRGYMDFLNHYDSLGPRKSGSQGTLESQGAPGGRMGHYASGGINLSGYRNPIPAGATPERIDQGVDFAGNGPIGAIGAGTIIETNGGGWPGGPYMSYRLDSGALAGLDVYVAENIRPVVKPGQSVKAGQAIATMFNGGTGIEMGFAAPGGGSPMSQTAAAGAISGANLPPGSATQVGHIFDELLVALGAPKAPNYNVGPAGKIPGSIPGGTAGALAGLAAFAKSAGGGLGGLLGAIFSDIEGLTSAAGSALAGGLKGLIGDVKGGAKELLKLAQAGARAVFDGVWDGTAGKMFGLAGNDTIPGDMVTGTGGLIKQGIDSFMGAQDSSAQAQAAASGVTGGAAGAVAAGSGLQNLITVAKFLMSHGYSAFAAAGAAGDMYGESGGNPESRNCVPLTYLVVTTRGLLRHDEVKVGDQTPTYNPATKQPELATILDVPYHDNAKICRIGNKGWSVICTWDHKWITEHRGLVRADRIVVGEKILLGEGWGEPVEFFEDLGREDTFCLTTTTGTWTTHRDEEVAAGEGMKPGSFWTGNSGGAGLLGWTPPSSARPDPNILTGNASKDLQTQMTDILGYNQIWASYIPALNASKNVTQAAEIYSKDFERPRSLYSDVNTGVSQQIYNAIAGSAANKSFQVGTANNAAPGGVSSIPTHAAGGLIGMAAGGKTGMMSFMATGGEPMVRDGSTGAAVRLLQSDLDKTGDKLSVDGIFGSHTLSAVEAFQKLHHLKVDGIVGPLTWAALMKVAGTGGTVSNTPGGSKAPVPTAHKSQVQLAGFSGYPLSKAKAEFPAGTVTSQLIAAPWIYGYSGHTNTASVPASGTGISTPVIPYHSTQSPSWNATVDAAWAAQAQFDQDYNTLLGGGRDSTKQKPAVQAGFDVLADMVKKEVSAWNAFALRTDLPNKLNRTNLNNVRTNMSAIWDTMRTDTAVRTPVGKISGSLYGNLETDIDAPTGLSTTFAAIENMWPQLWDNGALSPGHQTPGPGSTAGSVSPGSLPVPNLGGLLAIPVSPYDVAGHASGGYIGLNDLLGQVSIGPRMPSGRFGAQDPINAVRAATANTEPTRVRSEAAAASSGQGANVTFGDIKIYNPRPELSSHSITRSTQKAAWLAGRELG
jgi:peptidoglycan hydrolase-like protein with peptidoglycan-binding domain